MLSDELIKTVKRIDKAGGRITVLTGAGISAESGIPTFRGPEGYWTAGSQEYHPQELATKQMYQRDPMTVWRWYIYRRDICNAAKPNAGHFALATLEDRLQDRFTLITQNVDGLHQRAGNSMRRTFQIHGNIDYMRCADECSDTLYPLPTAIPPRGKTEPLSAEEWELLHCQACGGPTRPHVLWFDEYYSEEFFKFRSSLEVARQTDLLIIVGSSGNTNLPIQVTLETANHQGVIIDVNVQSNPFSVFALDNGGFFVEQPSSKALPALVALWD